MILDLDLGNSFLKWRCGVHSGRLAATPLHSDSLTEAWQLLAPQRVRLASVSADASSQLLRDWVQRQWQLEVEVATTVDRCAGVRNSYADPQRLGVDRWLAMLAGFARAGGACAVVDCGSAITIDYVDAGGVHLGGYILPGINLMRQSLLGNTQRVWVREDVAHSVEPGCSTEQAVQHGLELMLAALAGRVEVDSRRLLGPNAAVWVTGGDGERFAYHLSSAELVPDLVLDGLAQALPEVGSCAG